MAKVDGKKDYNSGGNVNLDVKVTDFSASRPANGNGTTVTLKFKVAVKTPDDYTENSIIVWVDGSGRKCVFDSNNGKKRTSKTTWYTSSQYTITKNVALGSTTTSFKVGVRATAWSTTPSSAAQTKTFNVSEIAKGTCRCDFHLNSGTGGPATNPIYVTSGNSITPANYKLPDCSSLYYNQCLGWADTSTSTSVFAAGATKKFTVEDDDLWAVRYRDRNITYTGTSGWSNVPANSTFRGYYVQGGDTHHVFASYTIPATKPTHPLKTFTGWSYTYKTYDISGGASKDQSGTTTAGTSKALTNLAPYADLVLTLKSTNNSYPLTLDGVTIDKTYSVNCGSTSPTSVPVDTTSDSTKKFGGWQTSSGELIFNASGAKILGTSLFDNNGYWKYAGGATLTPRWNTADMGNGPIRFGTDYKVYAARFTKGSKIQLKTNYEIIAVDFVTHSSNTIRLGTDGKIYAKGFVVQ